MKKSISFLSLAIVLCMQSCERSDLELNDSKEKKQNEIIMNHRETARETSASMELTPDSPKKGDEDPPRDKQHWRVKNDTIR